MTCDDWLNGYQGPVQSCKGSLQHTQQCMENVTPSRTVPSLNKNSLPVCSVF